jgi:hypothetical protein
VREHWLAWLTVLGSRLLTMFRGRLVTGSSLPALGIVGPPAVKVVDVAAVVVVVVIS